MLTPEVDPGPRTPWFWAHQFRLVGGDGGYLGLQTWGNLTDRRLERIAIFSIWNGLAAEGESPVRFGGEGTGWSCRIPYPWVAGRSYRLRVATDERAWWSASVTDEGSGVTRLIGRIRVDEAVTGLDRWSVMWTEHYGPIARCADLSHSRVVFTTPTADGGVVPERQHSHVGDGDCEGSSVEAVPGGVRHEMGA